MGKGCRQFRRAGQQQRGRARKNEGPDRDGHRLIVRQCITAEDAVKRIEEAGTQSQQNADKGNGQPARKQAAHAGAAHQCQNQCQQLFLRHRFFPQDRRHDHHEGRRRVQQNGCDSQRAHFLAGKIAAGKQQYADNARSKKVFDMFPLHAEHAAVTDGEQNRQHQHPSKIPHRHNTGGRQSALHESTVPQADGTPKCGRCQNGSIGRQLLILFFLLLLHKIPILWFSLRK